VTTLAELATATGVSATAILTAGAQHGVTLPADGPLPAQAYVPGCRDHVVVATTDGSNNQAVESKDQIASQNGVDTADLDRANPNRDWTAVTAGDRVLVPSH
jgi:hypothetical protein